MTTTNKLFCKHRKRGIFWTLSNDLSYCDTSYSRGVCESYVDSEEL